jgi:hypothetical protein
MGDRFFDLSLCHAWDEAGLTLRKSRYAGPFDMADGTLDTPMLVLSNVRARPARSARPLMWRHADVRPGDEPRVREVRERAAR